MFRKIDLWGIQIVLWGLQLIKFVVDWIGYATLDPEGAVSRLDKALAFIYSLPSWATLGVIFVASIFVAWIGRARHPTLPPSPAPVTVEPVATPAAAPSPAWLPPAAKGRLAEFGAFSVGEKNLLLDDLSQLQIAERTHGELLLQKTLGAVDGKFRPPPAVYLEAAERALEHVTALASEIGGIQQRCCRPEVFIGLVGKYPEILERMKGRLQTHVYTLRRKVEAGDEFLEWFIPHSELLLQNFRDVSLERDRIAGEIKELRKELHVPAGSGS